MRTISAIAALILVAGSCVAFKPGSTGYSATWLSVLKAGVEAPTDYLHFWNPAVTGDTDQGPGGNDGNSVNFDPDSADGWNMGTDDNKYVQLTGRTTNGTSYTVTAWIKPDITAMNANQFGGTIFADRTSGNARRDFGFEYLKGNGGLYRGVFFFDSSGTAIIATNSTYVHNEWQHVAFVVDGESLKSAIYVNAARNKETTFTNLPRDSTQVTDVSMIGSAASDLKNWPPLKYHGSIGKVRFYQRALTQAEIQAEIDSDGGTGP